MSSIISIDDLNDYMSKSLTPTVAQQAVDAVNAWVEKYTNRCWGETRSITERYDWKLVTYLRHQDVVSIDGIKLGYPGQTQSTFDPKGYYVNPLGRLTFFAYGYGGGPLVGNGRYHDWMEISYTYGVLDVPDDLKMAALAIAALNYNWATNGNKDIVATSVGTYKVQYSGSVRGAAGVPSPALHIEEANMQMINSYKTRRV